MFSRARRSDPAGLSASRQVGVILLAAGSGRRFGGSLPKQFQRVNGVPLLLRSLRVFQTLPFVNDIAVVVSPEHQVRVTSLLKREKGRRPMTVVKGGAYRGASVRNGFFALATTDRVVLVHDSARPLVTADIVRRVFKSALSKGAALAAWPLGDTLKLAARNGRVQKTIPRHQLYLAQTPQGFRRDVAEKCLARPSRTATDDVQLAERRGYPVFVVEGGPSNFKVTYPFDLELCRRLS